MCRGVCACMYVCVLIKAQMKVHGGPYCYIGPYLTTGTVKKIQGRDIDPLACAPTSHSPGPLLGLLGTQGWKLS